MGNHHDNNKQIRMLLFEVYIIYMQKARLNVLLFKRIIFNYLGMIFLQSSQHYYFIIKARSVTT